MIFVVSGSVPKALPITTCRGFASGGKFEKLKLNLQLNCNRILNVENIFFRPDCAKPMLNRTLVPRETAASNPIVI